MNLVHNLINIIAPFIMLISLVFILPLSLTFKLINSVKKTLFSENVAGKVILITGAASGIGEQLAYEYARRNALLVLVDVDEKNLARVSNKAKSEGSPDVLPVSGDVSKEEDCERFINQTINHFGRLNHLVNNAGKGRSGKFENIKKISDHISVMDVNLWGTIYCTHFAVPHLKKTEGKIVVISSICGWNPLPNLTIYNASKAALINFCETIRMEFGSKISVTIVMPGIIKTSLTQKMEMFTRCFLPQESSVECAKDIFRSACRGDTYLIVPKCYWWLFPMKTLCSEVVEYFNRRIFMLTQSKSSKTT